MSELRPKVVLLHGLARTRRSMAAMGRYLERNGFAVWNFGYASTRFPVETLADQVSDRIDAEIGHEEPIHFVTHSMGGILLRRMRRAGRLPNLARSVMLSPPNQGSEVVDKLGHWAAFKWLNGPAGQQLGTSASSVPNQLGPVDFELGILTGCRSVNLLLSTLFSGPNDGKVAVEKAKVAGMSAFKVVPATHPFIMRNRSVMRFTSCFLRNGVWE